VSKSYPPNLADLCRRYDGPTPCRWPECDCDEGPKRVHPFVAYVKNFLLSVSLVIGLCTLWLLHGSAAK
jgi:hypothetical protein